MTAVQIKDSQISRDFPLLLNSDFSGFSSDRERCKVGLNYYVYVGNNPVNRIDPTGLSWEDNVPEEHRKEIVEKSGDPEAQEREEEREEAVIEMQVEEILENCGYEDPYSNFEDPQLASGGIGVDAGSYNFNFPTEKLTDSVGMFASTQSILSPALKNTSRAMMGINTSRTLRDSAGNLMRKTGELAKRIQIKEFGNKASKVLPKIGKAATGISFVTGTLSIYNDFQEFDSGELGFSQFTYRSAVNVVGMIPTPYTAAISIAGGLAENKFFEE